MKKGFLLLVLIFFALISSAQNTIRIDKPYVEESYSSSYGATYVECVLIEAKETRVYISYHAKTNEDISISINPKTLLKVQGRNPMHIIKWGLDDNGDFSKLEFNKSYSIGSLRTFTFCLVFPNVPQPVSKITIEEDVSNGFYWKGIHLERKNIYQNPGHNSKEIQPEFGDIGSSTDSKSDHKGNDKKPDEGTEEYYQGNSTTHNATNPTLFQVNASGSCFALNSEGFLVTCYHVIENAKRIRIRGIKEDFEHPIMAEIFATDKNNDLAVLKITDQGFSGLGNIPYRILSEPSEVGEAVFTLGYPLRAVMGDEIKLTNGVISACSGYMGDISSYQLSATVQSGNSGCPVFNSEGNVIGVINARLENIESASYAIKEHYLNQFLQHNGIRLPSSHFPSMANEPMTAIIKKVKPFVYIVEVE